MRITIIAIGSRGDVQPYVALSRGLVAAGHTVCLATHAVFEKFVVSYGIHFMAIDDEPTGFFQGKDGVKLLEASNNAFLFVYRLRAYLAPRMDLYMQRSLEASRDADVIISTYMSFLIAYSIAEKLRCRLIASFLQPSMLPTTAFPEPSAPWLPQHPVQMGQIINEQSHLGSGKVFWHFFTPAVNRARQRLYGLPPLPSESLYATLPQHVDLILLGYSPLLLAKPDDWADNIEVTGFWPLEAPRKWEPAPQLVDFIQAGPPPVYIGFGSMISQQPQRTLDLAFRSLVLSGQRGIILTARETLFEQWWSKNIYISNGAPHDWLFPQMSAIVHHAGAGTTAASLRAGVPSIPVYHIADQQFWGTLAARAGAAHKPLSRHLLTPRQLARSIQTVLEDQAMRHSARQIAYRLRQEDGIQQAIQAIDRHLSDMLMPAQTQRNTGIRRV
ncbi:hypothetical protein KDA_44090 [Dictyobacter alpinus]|uniref:Uncharacterized protein n=1 Tax=Dictyobacter alpinus TaxID=2014873 RepID=A0A402BC38_9CHLR|nr:glycosyltransferase [Dictyobacter alpinus]GCE28925.1 hypothetical protein KDA_44090 [Dictyobacter alpinus]